MADVIWSKNSFVIRLEDVEPDFARPCDYDNHNAVMFDFRLLILESGIAIGNGNVEIVTVASIANLVDQVSNAFSVFYSDV